MNDRRLRFDRLSANEYRRQTENAEERRGGGSSRTDEGSLGGCRRSRVMNSARERRKATAAGAGTMSRKPPAGSARFSAGPGQRTSFRAPDRSSHSVRAIPSPRHMPQPPATPQQQASRFPFMQQEPLEGFASAREGKEGTPATINAAAIPSAGRRFFLTCSTRIGRPPRPAASDQRCRPPRRR